jgi:hypothetical protein
VPLTTPTGRCSRTGQVASLALAAFFGVIHAAAAQQAQPEPGSGTAPSAAIDYDTAHLQRRLPAVRASSPITLDGVVDEPAWSTAPVASGFIQNEPREGAPATYDTEVRVLYDDEALYFGVFAHDDQPSRIIVNDLKEDFSTGNSDGFRVVLDTFHDERNAYQFATNPAGAKWDAQMSNEGRENNADWDGIWDVRARVGETGWYAEIRIPFRTLRFNTSDVQTWGVNFERKVRRLNEDSHWAPLPRIYDIERVSLAGRVDDFRGLRQGRNLRIKPYAAGSSNTVGASGTSGDFDAGFDVKYGITNGLVSDFTVNTDFSQVEADEQQINLTRFSLFFPEKRDFFLENSGIFQFGAGVTGFAAGAGGGGGGGGGGRQTADLRMFFSRRIGLSEDGEAIPILFGTRLTGRQGAYSIGVLNVEEDEHGTEPRTNDTAIRVRRDVLANSDIGAILLLREPGGPSYNRVGGVDANFRFGSYLNVNGYAAKSFSPLESVTSTGNEYAEKAGVNYAGRVWQVQANVEGTGERFVNELGFVPRRGVNNYFSFLARRFRPLAVSSVIREIRPHAQFDAFYRQDGGALESRYLDFHFPITFQDSSNMEIGVNPNVEVISERFRLNTAHDVWVEPGRYDFNEYFIFWNTNAAARVSVNTRYAIGPFYDGYRRAYTVSPSLRLNENFNASVGLQINDIAAPTGGFVSKLLTTRVNYNFNTKMFFNALVQYNSDTRQWTSNLRFNIIHRPLSDFFLVYNDRRDERTGTLLSRAVIAKLTYLMAF